MKAINLVPREQRRSFGALQGLGLGTTALFGALSLAVVVVAAYVVLANTVTSKKAELAQVQAQQTAATRQVAQLKPYADLEQLRTALLDRVKGVAGSRYDWPGSLARIARAFPDNAKLSSLDGSAASDTTGPSIALSGCTPSHDDVAGLIDRLRAVKGVDGVALKSSTLSPQAAAGAQSGGGDACNLPEKFELSLTLEKPVAAVAGAATGATAAPATGTAATPTPTAPTTTGGTQ